MRSPPFDGTADRPLRIGFVSVSDRASTGVYVDQGIPRLTEWFDLALTSPHLIESRLVADEGPQIEAALIELVDEQRCDLVVTTGGTGPSRRDVTPEATLAVSPRELPGCRGPAKWPKPRPASTPRESSPCRGSRNRSARRSRGSSPTTGPPSSPAS